MGNKLTIHIVDSVKGGSGKSTFSAKLALSLKAQKEKKPCIIDLDLLGTSWYYIYANFVDIDNSYNNIVFLNDLISDFDYYKNLNYFNEIKFSFGVNELPITIPVIFCNPNPSEKNLFKVDEQNGYSHVAYSFFFESIKKLVNELEDIGFTDIIFDMPPNSEQYSDGILNYYLRTNWESDSKLYMVSSYNMAHIKSTFAWYRDFLEKTPSQHNIIPESTSEKKIYHFVFNDVNNTINTLNISNIKKEKNNIISLSKKHNVAKQLLYYFVDFDSVYMVSATPFYKNPSSVIKCNSQFDINNCEKFKNGKE